MPRATNPKAKPSKYRPLNLNRDQARALASLIESYAPHLMAHHTEHAMALARVQEKLRSVNLYFDLQLAP